jgi:hypothetical protein
VHFNTKAVRITKEGVACHGRTERFSSGPIPLLTPRESFPLTDKMMKLSASSPLFYAVGDCDGKPAV